MKPLAFLHKTVSFVKFEISAPPISSLTKSPLFSSPCFRASVVSFFHSVRHNHMVTGHTRAFKDHKAQKINRLRNYLTINDP